MENFKISQFNNKKKIVFENGRMEIIPQELNGEIELYDFDKDRIQLINDKVITKISNNTSDIEKAYKILPYLGTIEVDVSFDEFKSLQSNPLFKKFIIEMSLHINNIFLQAKDIKESEDELNKVIEENPELKEQIEKKKEKSKEEKLDELIQELFKVKGDDKKRDEILHKINKLKEEK